MRTNLAIKILILLILAGIFAIVLGAIGGVMGERKRFRDGVVDEIAQSTAKAQTLIGPILVLRYREKTVTRTEQNQPATERVSTYMALLLPESLAVRTSVQVEERYRGIYKAHVYRSTHRLAGVFRVPAHFGLAETNDVVGVEPAQIEIGVTDSRGLRKPPQVVWQGSEVAVRTGTDLAWLEQGASAAVGPAYWPDERRIPFEINVDLMGTERLSLIPVGATTTAQMDAGWPHPGFIGGFLPDERTITSHGFLATWQLSRFATGIEGAIQRRQSGVEQALDNRDFGVRFVQPVDVYQQSERAVKYGMLFVTLTFVAFLLFEVLKRLAVHPVQYTLAGAAVALFFLLLISLSEHVPFGVAYLAASGACVGLLGFYVSHVLGSVTRGVGFGALVAMLYGVLYVLLQSEDYALLLGSLLLFVLLAAIMVMTRRVDWYRLGESKATS